MRNLSPINIGIRSAGSLCAAIVVVMLLSSPTFAAKINLSHVTTTLGEGQSQAVNVTLDEPIISGDLNPGYVTLTLDISATDRVALDVTELTWAQAEWAQTRTFTITAVDDGDDNGDESVAIVTMPIDSNSEYYTNFNPANVTVNVLDNDEAPVVAVPVVQSSATTASSTLANTGDSSAVPFVLGLCLLVSGIIVVAFREEIITL